MSYRRQKMLSSIEKILDFYLKAALFLSMETNARQEKWNKVRLASHSYLGFYLAWGGIAYPAKYKKSRIKSIAEGLNEILQQIQSQKNEK